MSKSGEVCFIGSKLLYLLNPNRKAVLKTVN